MPSRMSRSSASPPWAMRIAPAVNAELPPDHSRSAFSSTRTRHPRARAACAADMPAVPAPTTIPSTPSPSPRPASYQAPTTSVQSVPAARRSRWTSFAADRDAEPPRGLHEDGNPAHRLRVEHDADTLLVHLSDEDGAGWTVLAVDRATRRFA